MNQAESIFEEVLELAPADRPGFLLLRCVGDSDLRHRVEKLVEVHERAERLNFLPPVLELSTEKSGDWIDRYKLLEKIGEGGCGVIYVAEQAEPVRRRVALKVIKLGMDTKAVVARFEFERQALAMMDHPNIARVLDAGATNTGRPFFIMELVRGVRITDYCNENNLNTLERLDLFIKVCQAIQHAHQKGIIHRDIKPSNILVTMHDGVPVPKVIDFGIAKATEGRLTNATVYTHLQQFIGTPAYMSPEQAELSGLDIDTRSDIYSLGVLLYELLTGQPPFDGQQLVASGIDAMRKTIREKEPARPSTRLTQLQAGPPNPQLATRHSSLATDLDWIVMKCLEKDRSRRYDTATGLAADLKRHLKNEPVTARPPSPGYKFQKAWRRNKVGFTAMGAVAAALILGTVVSTWQALKAGRAKNSEIKQRLEAQIESSNARRDRYIALVNLAGSAWEEDNFNVLRQSLADTRSYPERGFEWYYLQRQAHLHSKTLPGHIGGEVYSVAFSGDGKRLATGGSDRTARIWEVASGRELIEPMQHQEKVWSVAFSPDGRWIVTGSEDNVARIWNAATGGKLFELSEHTASIRSVAFSLDGQRIVTASHDRTARVWDANTRQVLAILTGHSQQINAAAFSPDGQWVVTGSSDGTARVWEAISGKELHRLTGNGREIYSVTFSPDGETILTGGVDSIARVWNAATGLELSLRHLVGRGTMTSLAFSRDGKFIVTGSWTSTATLWDPATSRKIRTFPAHGLGVRCLAISPDGRQIVTGSGDDQMKVWEVEGDRDTLTINGDMTNILALAISPDGGRIVTGTGTRNADNGTVGGTGDQPTQLWDLTGGRKLLTLGGRSAGISSVAFSRDGHRVVTGSGDGKTTVWDADNGNELSTFTGTGSVSSVAFSLGGQRVVTGSHDHTARVWDIITRQELFPLIGHTDAVSSVVISPDGRMIITGSFDQSLRSWDAASGAPVRTIQTPMKRILSLAFSPDGLRLVAGGWHSMAMVWEIGTNREPLPLLGHNGPVSSVSFSPDGKRIMTASLDKTIKIWDASSGRQLVTLNQPFPVSSGIFSPVGQSIITGSWDGTIRVWKAASPAQVAAWEKEERAAEEVVNRPGGEN